MYAADGASSGGGDDESDGSDENDSSSDDDGNDDGPYCQMCFGTPVAATDSSDEEPEDGTDSSSDEEGSDFCAQEAPPATKPRRLDQTFATVAPTRAAPDGQRSARVPVATSGATVRAGATILTNALSATFEHLSDNVHGSSVPGALESIRCNICQWLAIFATQLPVSVLPPRKRLTSPPERHGLIEATNIYRHLVMMKNVSGHGFFDSVFTRFILDNSNEATEAIRSIRQLDLGNWPLALKMVGQFKQTIARFGRKDTR